MTDYRKEIQLATQTVYELDSKTPLEPLLLSSGPNLFLKREDQSAIHSYKWRGAFNKMVRLIESGNHGPFVTTSAGNHAQGVAAGANKLDVKATIFMPTSTPLLKQHSVIEHGQANVEIVLVGDTFDQAQSHAAEFAAESDATILPPFDDPQVIAGQATVGVEIMEQMAERGVAPDVVYVPVGGGGLAGGVSTFLKQNSPATLVVGVEVVGQDAMRQSLEACQRVTLTDVDRFCDGTAVACPGVHTFDACRRNLDKVITVTNDQVCAAIQMTWEKKRLITEPSGAIALAGFLSQEHSESENIVVVISGSNTDFLTLPIIARRNRMSQPTRRYFQFELREQNGALIYLLDQLMEGVNIVDFQFGKTSLDRAMPVLGFNATETELAQLAERIAESPISATEVTGEDTVAYRVIPFQPELTHDPCFLRVDFPNRPGALRDLMRRSSGLTSICYFNFQESGESEGHALIGFEFEHARDRENFFAVLDEFNFKYKYVNAGRLLGLTAHQSSRT